MAQWAHLYSLLMQVDKEVGEPLALRDVVVGASQKDRPVRKMGPRGPYLLAADDPLVAVTLGPGGQRGEVGAGPGLAEELAPDLLVADDGGKEKDVTTTGGKVRVVGGFWATYSSLRDVCSRRVSQLLTLFVAKMQPSS